jgi:hypothetical protein
MLAARVSKCHAQSENAIQCFHSEYEKKRRVTLPQSTLVTNVATNLSIHRNPGAGSSKNDRDPIDPSSRETHVAKQIQQDDRIKCFSYIDFEQHT